MQRVTDFLDGVDGSKLQTTGEEVDEGPGPVRSSYRLGVKEGPLHELYPSFVTEALRKALLEFDKQMPGFVCRGTARTDFFFFFLFTYGDHRRHLARSGDENERSCAGHSPCGLVRKHIARRLVPSRGRGGVSEGVYDCSTFLFCFVFHEKVIFPSHFCFNIV